MIRTHLVKALYENLLGPKMESTESIEEPFLKYELGILNSSFSPDVVVPGNKTVIDDTPNQFEEGDTETTTNVEGTQLLDHLRREIDTDLSLLDGVSSVGISFVLEPKNENENKIPQFKVCLTWGRYTRNVEFGELPKMFDRHPNHPHLHRHLLLLEFEVGKFFQFLFDAQQYHMEFHLLKIF